MSVWGLYVFDVLRINATWEGVVLRQIEKNDRVSEITYHVAWCPYSIQQDELVDLNKCIRVIDASER